MTSMNALAKGGNRAVCIDIVNRWPSVDLPFILPASEGAISRIFLDINYHLSLSQGEIDINHGVLVHYPDYK